MQQTLEACVNFKYALEDGTIVTFSDHESVSKDARKIMLHTNESPSKRKARKDVFETKITVVNVDCLEQAIGLRTGSGRAFSGFGIRPKYGAGIGNTISILTGSGILLFPGKRDSPKLGDGTRDFCLHVCRECPFKSNTLWSVWLIGLNG